jgi:predicted nicotinamide N-methyase
MTPGQRRDFIRANTEILTPPLVPEVKLHLAHEALPIWQKTEEELDAIGLPPPFWAFAWAGGQALARHILDNPEIVKGKRVLDLASGSGLVAITAMKAGAARVAASEIDQFAVEAVALNAGLNAVLVTPVASDLLDRGPPLDLDVILVGDLFYEKHLATHCLDWLIQAHVHGIDVLIGDPGRSYLPKEKLKCIAEYAVPVTRELEDTEIKRTAVWRLA